MQWRQLELLRCVVEGGGFAQAASLAGVSQPAISQAMRRLAADIGEPLFEQRGRRQVPTRRALALAAAMRTAGDRVRALATGDGQPKKTPAEQVIRVGLAPAAGLLYGPTMVRALAELTRPPRLSIATGSAPTMLDELVRGELDLVIAPRPRGLHRLGLHECVMYVNQPRIFCRQGHAMQSATSLRQIARAHWVVAGQAGTPGNVVEEAFRVRRWAPPNIAVHCADYAMLAQMVADSDLLGVIPHPRLASEPNTLGLVQIRVEEGLPHYEVCLFWPQRAPRQPTAVARLVAALSSCASQDAVG